MTKKVIHSSRLPLPYIPSGRILHTRRHGTRPLILGRNLRIFFKRIRVTIPLVATVLSIIPANAFASVETLPAPIVEDFETPIKIKAFNPGYTVNGVANVGEFIELAKVSDEPSISLTGFSLRYTNSSGKSSNLFEFPEGSEMTGETILLRLASAPDSELADLNYTKTLALEAGPLELVYREETVDSVCWKGKECLSKFSTASPTSIVQDLQKGEYSHISDYIPAFSVGRRSYSPPPEDEVSDGTGSNSEPQCHGLIFNELLSYYENEKSEQFIEFFNPTEEAIQLDGCKVRYKKRTYSLTGMVDGTSFYVYNPEGFTLTKNPTTSNLLELVDVDGKTVDALEYPHGQKKATAYALFRYNTGGEPEWKITHRPTPGAENIEQEFRSCAEGKVLNEATGNCVKAASLKTTMAECPEGKYRNPLTGRCKKIEEDGTSECKEGYERNPETGRCRKIKQNSGAEYALVPEAGGEKVVFVAMAAIGGVIAFAVGYVGFQYRREIKRFFVRVFHRRKG